MGISKQKGASLIGILVIILISVSALFVVRKINDDASYKQEADAISQRVLAFSSDANYFTANNYDCRGLGNAYMISNGLIPKGWGYDKNVTGVGLPALVGIHYKYGDVNIGSDLSVGELPSAQLGRYDGYKITLFNYPFVRLPRFIDQLIPYFDYININSTLIKSEDGLNNANYNTILNMHNGNTTIELINWGC